MIDIQLQEVLMRSDMMILQSFPFLNVNKDNISEVILITEENYIHNPIMDLLI